MSKMFSLFHIVKYTMKRHLVHFYALKKDIGKKYSSKDSMISLLKLSNVKIFKLPIWNLLYDFMVGSNKQDILGDWEYVSNIFQAVKRLQPRERFRTRNIKNKFWLAQYVLQYWINNNGWSSHIFSAGKN